jgi:hypothetical protein
MSIMSTDKVKVRTGTPVEVRMIATSVGEKDKLALALAVVNLAVTRLVRASDRPSSILGGKVQEARAYWKVAWVGTSFPGKIACTDDHTTSHFKPHDAVIRPSSSSSFLVYPIH